MRHTASRRLVLASSSPRRRELLALLSLPFEVVAPPLEEASLPKDKNQPPEIVAERLAIAKAESAAYLVKEGVFIGADTVVVLEGEILGKPKDPRDAEGMLRRLRGREHSVVTGVSVLEAPKGNALISHAKTDVVMRRYSDREMADYIASGDPMDKAGAYAIQDPAFHPVKRVNGCYMNVVGLPLCTLSALLIQAGFPILWKPPANSSYCSFCRAPLSRLKEM